MDGFGDFLIVGEDYSEAGGPACAVAIHLTFIDPDQNNSMCGADAVRVRSSCSTVSREPGMVSCEAISARGARTKARLANRG